MAIDTANLRFSLAALELRTDALKSIALPLLAGTRGYAIRDLMGAIIEHSVAWLKVSRYMKAINFYVLEEEIVSLCRQDRPERSGKAGPAAWGEGKKLARVGIELTMSTIDSIHKVARDLSAGDEIERALAATCTLPR